MKKLLALVSLCILAAAFGGCDEEKPAASNNPAPPAATEPAKMAPPVESVPAAPILPATPATPAAPAKPVDPKAMVVKVNGTVITEGQVIEEVNKRVAAMKLQRPGSPDPTEEQKQMLRTNIVDMLVDQELIKQTLAEKKITVTDEQITQEITKIATQQNQKLEDVEKEIAKYGMTMDDLKGQIAMKLQMDALAKAEGALKDVTEEDAKKFYDENPQHFNQSEQVKASHILCGKRGITEAEYAAELEKIKAAQARLKAGEAFEDVAKDVSTCPSSAKGGDLGFFGKGQMDPAFEKAAFELEVGKTTDIVKTSFGYHIIKVTDKKAAEVTPFADVKEQITQHLSQQQQRTFWPEYQKKLKDAATIEYSEAEQAARKKTEDAQKLMQQQMMQRIQQQMAQQQAQQAAEGAKDAAAPADTAAPAETK